MNTTAISQPRNTQHIAVEAMADTKYLLNFSPDQATLDRTDNDLIFKFEDGSSVSVVNFYSAYTKDSMPDFEIDGSRVSGNDFFTAFGPNLAPGADTSAVERSSHYAEHDNAELAVGIDHLGGLDMGLQNAPTVVGMPLQFTSAAMDKSGLGGTTPGNGGTDGGDPTIYAANVRAVLYTRTGGSDTVDVPLQGQYAFVEDNGYWAANEIGGKLAFSLTSAGMAALQALGPDGMLANYATVAGVDTNGKSFSYTVQLVGIDAATHGNNTTYTFDSAACDDLYGPVSGIDGTMSYQDQKGNTGTFFDSNFAQYRNSAKLFINGSAGNDEITVKDALTGESKIYASGDPAAGALADDKNKIILNGGIANNGRNSIEVLSSDGEFTSNAPISASYQGSLNTIDMGKGDVTLNSVLMGNLSTSTLSADQLGKNLVITEGDVNVQRFVTGGTLLKAQTGGVNEIAVGGEGDVHFTAGTDKNFFGSIAYAAAGSANKVSTVDGDITMESAANYSQRAIVHSDGGNSSNSFYTEHGKISTTIGSGNTFIKADGKGALVSFKTGHDGSPTADNDAGSITINNPNATLAGALNGGRVEIETRVGDIVLDGDGMRADDNGSSLNIEVKERGDITYNSRSSLLGSTSNINVSTADGNITMHSSTPYGYSIVTATHNGKLNMHSGNGNIDISGGGRVLDPWYGGEINLTADHGDIRLTSGTVDSNRQTVDNVGSEIALTATDGNIVIDTNTAASSTSAVTAWGGGNTIISASDEVVIKAVSTGGTATGLEAVRALSTNTVMAQGDNSLNLTIDVTAKGAANAVGMWARLDGKNYIVGENGNNEITIRANNGAGVAMRTDGASENIIILGGGGSKIIIDGSVEGIGNSIQIGGDGNTVILNGKVGSGALAITPKDNGTFELALQAADSAALNAQYGAWLTALADDSDFLSGLLKINLEGSFSAADLQTLYPALHDVLSIFATENVVIEINGENHSADFGASLFSAGFDFSAQDAGDSHTDTNEGSGEMMFAASTSPVDDNATDSHGAVTPADAGEHASGQQETFAESHEMEADGDMANDPLLFSSLAAITADTQGVASEAPNDIAKVANVFAEDATLDSLFDGESAQAKDLSANQENFNPKSMDLANKSVIEEARDIAGEGVKQEVSLSENEEPSNIEANSGTIAAESSVQQLMELGHI